MTLTHGFSELPRVFSPLLVLTFIATTRSAWPTASFAAEEDVRLSLSFNRAVRAEPFTGRVYAFFSRNQPSPRMGPNWFNPEPFIARDVKDWPPDTPLRVDWKSEEWLRFPKSLQPHQLLDHKAQGVVRFNPWERDVGNGPGNGFSPVITVKSNEESQLHQLTVDSLVPELQFEETEGLKLVRVRSESLTRFHGREVYLNAAVVLPASYAAEPTRHYPVLFSIPGFGGTHFHASRRKPSQPEENSQEVEFLRVTLDPSCPGGHHVLADSANNGPWGTAFVAEFLPEFDRRFRTIAEVSGRYLTGHSSGGWSSLWLQITHPETFNGTWSTAPDPVDFRDFQRINLYREGENCYHDAHGNRRPLARSGTDTVRVWFSDFDHMETVLGQGGQLASFDAVFSPRGGNGSPMKAWNRDTGAVNRDVTAHWERYDIRLQLRQRWPELKDKLAGKLHVFMGDADTFYLEGATVLLKEELKNLGSDAVVEIHPGKDHSSLMTKELRDRIRTEIAERFLKSAANINR